MYRNGLKRVLDILMALILLCVLSPLLLLVWILVHLTLGSPAIFVQERPGRNGQSFWMTKFRTMTDARDASGKLLPDKDRVTALGRFLRKSSLDELPELLNVLRGDMSMVGPRPLLTKYLPYYTERENLRHSVRPGITGLAQVRGRNALPWDERLEQDVWYVENCSFLLDVRIVCETVLKVVNRTGVVVVTDSTMRDLDVERRSEWQ